ncbi:DUF1648 domain-containing protein [Chryseobacterium sp. JUb7]|uniref:DUF1648 domain-containing protein n=1 Tax=Chryseobacterium sp. JUb7 TaxID=2940599 RepID=UPI00216930C0|nr:DUF1648 domain-containing protein [Chryseobacterium sp. JUb7]MCS3530675.1 putative membrane protein [Chryseobacterium sp. JUb7]
MKTSTFLLIINIALLIFIWVFTGVKYAELPEIVPSHFAVNGKVDGESAKNTIWFLPAIATFVFLALIGVSRNPDSPLLHVPQSFRNKETLKLYMYSMLLPVLLLLGDTVVESILIAQGRLAEMTNIVFVLLALMFGVMGFCIFKMLKESRTEILNTKN